MQYNQDITRALGLPIEDFSIVKYKMGFEITLNQNAQNLKAAIPIKAFNQDKAGIFIGDRHSKTLYSNEANAALLQVDSAETLKGQLAAQQFHKTDSQIILANNEYVMQNEACKFVEYHLKHKDKSTVHTLAIAVPLYYERAVIGFVFACMAKTETPYMSWLEALKKLNISENLLLHLQTYVHTTPRLSKRETDVVRLIKQGLSARKISNELNLSIRTVEFYIDNIKAKVGASNKYELLIKLLN